MKFISDTLVVVSVTPNGIFVAHLREFLKYIGCSMILEGCNEALHNVIIISRTLEWTKK